MLCDFWIEQNGGGQIGQQQLPWLEAESGGYGVDRVQRCSVASLAKIGEIAEGNTEVLRNLAQGQFSLRSFAMTDQKVDVTSEDHERRFVSARA